MINTEIDDIFRQNLENLNDLPKNVRWNKDEGWQRFSKSKEKKTMKLYPWLAAASVAILLALGLYFYQNTRTLVNCISSNSNAAVKEISLKGGHKCFLAQGSKIQYCYAKTNYGCDTLYLTGLAYIETNPLRKMVINAKNTITVCNNAKVNIKAEEGRKQTIISTISGSIVSKCTENGFPEMAVNPGERCVIFADGIFASTEPNTDPNFLAWKTGTLTFDNTPLKYAIQTIEDYYGVSIEVQSADIKYCNYTSKFNHSALNDVIGNIQKTFDTKAIKSNNEIVLEGGICKGN